MSKRRAYKNLSSYMGSSYKIILLVILSSITLNALAKNCGVIGTTYPIAETDLRQVIQARLVALQQSGELARLQAKLNQNLTNQMARPQPVTGLTRTQVARTRLFDPSWNVPADIKNSAGEIVVPKGTRINPLSTISLNETLLFYNADDPDQVRWAQQTDQQLKGQDKLILVQGPVTDQMKRFNKPVYFDQGGRLTQRFGLTHVPAVITQQGNRLKIGEVAP